MYEGSNNVNKSWFGKGKMRLNVRSLFREFTHNIITRAEP